MDAEGMIGNLRETRWRPSFEDSLLEGDGAMWNRSGVTILFLVGALALSSCAVSEERTGPGADGVPSVQVACAEGVPDCQDTLVTGGEDPLAPSTSSDGSASSGMVVDALSITDALSYEGSEPVAVAGFVVRTSESSRFCDALAESYPPQCAGESIDIINPEVTDAIPLIEEGNVQWSPDRVTVIGIITSEGITIDPTST